MSHEFAIRNFGKPENHMSAKAQKMHFKEIKQEIFLFIFRLKEKVEIIFMKGTTTKYGQLPIHKQGKFDEYGRPQGRLTANSPCDFSLYFIHSTVRYRDFSFCAAKI